MSDISMNLGEDDPGDLNWRLALQPPRSVDGIAYTPLDESSYQIRLINILPDERDSTLVRCTVETVSLQSYASKYQEFISKCTSSGRKRVIEWNHAHTPPSSHNTIHTHAPDPGSRRFT